MSQRRIRRKVPRPQYHAVNQRGVLMEDMIMCMRMGVDKLPDGHHVEHINGNTLDNRDSNLRLVADGE